MSDIENVILLKKIIAEKSKINYHIRKVEGRNKKIIPVELQKKRGRPAKDKTIIIIKQKPIKQAPILETRGRKVNTNIDISNLPKYLLKAIN